MPEEKPGLILTINYGGGGGEYGIARVDTGEVIEQSKRPIALPVDIEKQLEPRQRDFDNWANERSILLGGYPHGPVRIVVARGPAIKPDAKGQPNNFGIYSTTPDVIRAIEKRHLVTVHGSQFSAIVANQFAQRFGVPGIFRDPISCLQLPRSGALTGHPEILFLGLGHWLNIAEALEEVHFGQRNWHDLNIVACHFGTGFTIAAFMKGHLKRVNNANAGGPPSDARAGELPTEGLIDLVFTRIAEGESAQDIKNELQGRCGLFGLTGAKDLQAVYKLINDGNGNAAEAYEIDIERIGEEIARRYVNLDGHVDGLLLTGGMVSSERFVTDVTERVSFLTGATEICVVPGSREMAAMVRAARSVILYGAKPIPYGPLS